MLQCSMVNMRIRQASVNEKMLQRNISLARRNQAVESMPKPELGLVGGLRVNLSVTKGALSL
jgi:hypothetical protein